MTLQFADLNWNDFVFGQAMYIRGVTAVHSSVWTSVLKSRFGPVGENKNAKIQLRHSFWLIAWNAAYYANA